MKREYHIDTPLHIVHGLRPGVVIECDFEAGDIAPRSADEAAVLEHLLLTGQASLVKPKPKKET